MPRERIPRTETGLESLRNNIAKYPFICYTNSISYPKMCHVEGIGDFQRFELRNRAVWMFTNPADMRIFKRQFVTIDNSVQINDNKKVGLYGNYSYE